MTTLPIVTLNNSRFSIYTQPANGGPVVVQALAGENTVTLNVSGSKAFGGPLFDILSTTVSGVELSGGPGDDLFTIRGLNDAPLLRQQGNPIVFDGETGTDDTGLEVSIREFPVRLAGSNISLQAATPVELRNIEIVSFNEVTLFRIADEVIKDVFILYDVAFGRLPDSNGFRSWALRADTTPNMAAFFLDSPEGRSLTGNMTNAGFVDYLYQNVLERPGEATGVTFWTNQLNTGGLWRDKVVEFFADSPELRAKIAADYPNGWIMYDRVSREYAPAPDLIGVNTLLPSEVL